MSVHWTGDKLRDSQHAPGAAGRLFVVHHVTMMALFYLKHVHVVVALTEVCAVRVGVAEIAWSMLPCGGVPCSDAGPSYLKSVR